MTNNKPKVVAWKWRKPVVNDHGETVGGTCKLGEAPGVPLVCLSDYKALQAECEKLRAAMIEAKGHISHYIYGGSSYREPAVAAIELIDAALAAHRKQGGEV